MDSPKVIGKRIRRLRLERGWSQHDLAVKAGTRGNTISRIEKGDNAARRKTLFAIAQALDLDVRELAGDEEAEQSQLDRIEAKLDSIIVRLAQDAEVVRLPPPKPRPSSRPNREGQ